VSTTPETSERARFRRPLIGALTALLILVLGSSVYVGIRAHSEPRGEDFWSVAVPGLLTGFGTLALAVVTVWIALSERSRDDRLRAQQYTDLQAQAGAIRDAEALREARKVMTNVAMDDSIQITNAGTEPILDVVLIGGSATEQVRWWWFDTEWSWTHIMSGETVTSASTWSDTTVGAGFNRVALSALQRGSAVVHIAWTDSSGLYWRRAGRDLPARLDEPYQR
jgi:hypothetical protein